MSKRDAIERGLLSAVLADQKIEPVVEAGINGDFFSNELCFTVWSFIYEHWTEHGQVPSNETITDNRPDWRRVRSPEPLSYYITEIRDWRRKEILVEAHALFSEAMDNDDTEGALNALSRAVMDANSEVSSMQSVDLETTIPDRVERLYDEWVRNPGLRGMSTGFDTINKATRGVQPEQYIVVVGAQKAGKSTILMYMGLCMNEISRARVLFISFEMSEEEQAARHDALKAEINYSRLLEGKMTKADRRRLLEAHTPPKRAAGFILGTDITALTTVGGIRAQVQRVKPDVILIDGAYLMQDERGEPAGTPQALTNISRDLKRLAQATKIPVIVSTQALESKMQKKVGVTASSAGYTSAWGQDCDVMLGIQRMDEPKISQLRVLLSRSGPLAISNLRIDWEAGRIEELDAEEEYSDSEEKDTGPGRRPF